MAPQHPEMPTLTGRCWTLSGRRCVLMMQVVVVLGDVIGRGLVLPWARAR
jgi:hypothetical protein